MFKNIKLVILLGICSGIYITFSYINPYEKVISLDELILQISGGRGNLSMGTNLPELIGFMLRMMPTYVVMMIWGNKLYGYFCTASIYVFSRCPNRKKWYKKTWMTLLVDICVYETLFLITTIIITMIRYKVLFSSGGLMLMGYHLLIYIIWIFTWVMIINLMAISYGSSTAFIIAICLQMVCTSSFIIVNVLERIQTNEIFIDIFLRINPVAHIVLGWHKSIYFSSELYNSRYSMSLMGSFLFLMLCCIGVIKWGKTLIIKHEILVEDIEMEVI